MTEPPVQQLDIRLHMPCAMMQSDKSTCAATWHHAPCALMQYNPAPGSHGSVKFLYARIADIFMGTIITSLFTLVLPWSVPPPYHSLQSNPPTCLQHLPSAVPHLPSAPPSLPSAVPPLAFSNPFTCFQQSLHLPSIVLLLPSAVSALVCQQSLLSSNLFCLQQYPYLPSAIPYSPSAITLLAFSSLTTCLQ